MTMSDKITIRDLVCFRDDMTKKPEITLRNPRQIDTEGDTIVVWRVSQREYVVIRCVSRRQAASVRRSLPKGESWTVYVPAR